MPAGKSASIEGLPERARHVLSTARRGILTTTDAAGWPHAVPVCFAVRGKEIVTAIDHKPKSGRRLGRLRNIDADPRVAVLVDAWDEDWTYLAWVLVRGRARIEEPGAADDVLLPRYPQYRERAPEGQVIAIRPDRITWWSWR